MYAELSEGQLINNKYRVLEYIAEGGYSNVWKVEELKTKKKYALKVQQSGDDYTKWAKEEVIHLTELKGEKHVIHLRDTFGLSVKGSGNHVCFLFDLYETCLTDYLEKWDEEITDEIRKKILKQIVLGLMAIHKHKIIQGDIKCDNILIKKDTLNIEEIEVAITDFSLSFPFEHDDRGMNIQTIYYRAPEIVFGCDFDKNVDLWSLGELIIKLYSGHHNFNTDVYLNDNEIESDTDSESSTHAINSYKDEMTLLSMMESLFGKIPLSYFKDGDYFNRYTVKNGKKYKLAFKIDYNMIPLEELLDYNDEIILIIIGLMTYIPKDRMQLEEVLLNLK